MLGIAALVANYRVSVTALAFRQVRRRPAVHRIIPKNPLIGRFSGREKVLTILSGTLRCPVPKCPARAQDLFQRFPAGFDQSRQKAPDSRVIASKSRLAPHDPGL